MHTGSRQLDKAVKEIIDTQYARAKKILVSNRQALDTLAKELLKHETLEGKHVEEILEHGEMKSPLPTPLTSQKPPRKRAAKPSQKVAPQNREQELELEPTTKPEGIPA